MGRSLNYRGEMANTELCRGHHHNLLKCFRNRQRAQADPATFRDAA